ncbi:MAG: aromatic hydrocarbon degradation protein [Candidatus Azobacteroides sp.]|nr:aromatic hydrocarbon degradation protein [Candidatus Azobacteroides sp.]
MKTTKKIILTSMACCFYASGLLAGGLLTNTNQSVHFLRNPARDASTEIDAVYTNPAGLANLSGDGFHFSLNNQSAFQTRTTTSTFEPFALFGENATKEYKGTAKALVIPSLLAAYKTEKWVFSGSFAVVGGGGTLTFDKGLPSFEAMVASQIAAPLTQLSQASQAFGGPSGGYSVDMRLKGSSITYGVQLGATYKINDMFSAFVGGRVNIVDNSYEGYLRNVQITGGLGDFFTGAANMANVAASNLQPAVDGGFGNAPLSALGLPAEQIALMAAGLGMTAEQLGNLPVSQVQNALSSAAAQAGGAAAGVSLLEAGASATDLQLNTKQTGLGVAPILGVNFNWNKLNVGVKYEFKTSLTLKNDTKVNTTPMPDFDNDFKTPYDIPALLTVGAQYAIIPSVKVSAGYHHFFDSGAKMADDKQKYINGGISEYLFGAEWQIDPMFLVSAGGQVTRTGVTDPYQADMNFSLNSYSIGFGGAVNVSESVRINIAYFFTNYDDWSKTPGGGTTTDVFSRTNKVFGVGVDFRF